MRKLSSLILIGAIGVSLAAKAEYNNPKVYAQDKLSNAELQLAKLEEQKDAINKMIKAVKLDLKAAKKRAKAERLQSKADAFREDASTLVQQSGVAIDLPNLMLDSGVDAKLANGRTPDESELLFPDKSQTKSVFFPGSSGIENDMVLPPDVK